MSISTNKQILIPLPGTHVRCKRWPDWPIFTIYGMKDDDVVLSIPGGCVYAKLEDLY